MSLIPHTFFPRSMFDMDTWRPQQSFLNSPFFNTWSPSSLEIFDPFDELDRMLSRNLQWIDKPAGFLPALNELASTFTPTRTPQRHRFTIDCAGFKPDSIKTEIKDNNLVVSGFEESGQQGSDYSKKEFRKVFTLPQHAQPDKMVSYLHGGQLMVEVPLATPETSQDTFMSFLPQIVDGGKSVQVGLQIPENVDPSKIQVSVKDRDLIVKVEDKVQTPDSFSRVHIFNKTRLPANTDFANLKCTHENNKLNIWAPLTSALTSSAQNIPVMSKGSQQSIQQQPQQQQQQQTGSSSMSQ